MTGTSPSGWPDDWERRKKGEGCLLCAALTGAPFGSMELVGRGHWTAVYTDRRAVPGYCTVVWAGGHAVEPTELPAEAANGYWQEVLAAARAAEVAFQPVKLNFLTLGNNTPHLHTLVLPRYADDPAPGQTMPMDRLFSFQRDQEEAGAMIDRLRSFLDRELEAAVGQA